MKKKKRSFVALEAIINNVMEEQACVWRLNELLEIDVHCSPLLLAAEMHGCLCSTLNLLP